MKLPSLATDKQRQLFEFGSRHNYALLCADMRLGKSAVVIWLQELRNVNCLIVCPSYLIPNWKKEILKWRPGALVTTFQKGSEIYEPCDCDFVVTSYNLVQKAEHLFEWADCVVADEVHNLKSISTKRTEFFHRALFENSVRYFYGLTGTPLKNRVQEFYSLLALVHYDPKKKDPEFLEVFPDEISFAERFSFRKEYEVKVQTRRGATFRMPLVKYTGLRRVAELKDWIKDCYIRIRADAKDFPPLSYVDTLVSDIDDSALLESFNAFFYEDDEVPKDERQREDRVASVLPEHKRNAALKKVPFTIQYVENLLESVDNCLVYSDHREPVERLAEHFKVPAITGKMPGKRRAELVAEFQAGKSRVICSTIGALKEGADLYRANDIVLNDICWVPGDLLQVVNRIRKIGETNPKTVHRIFGSPQDEKISKTLEEKTKIIEAAT